MTYGPDAVKWRRPSRKRLLNSSRCQHVWIRPGRSWPVPRPQRSTAASMCSVDPTAHLDSRSSGVTQRTWERGRQWRTSPVLRTPLRPMSNMPPSGLSRGLPTSIDKSNPSSTSTRSTADLMTSPVVGSTTPAHTMGAGGGDAGSRVQPRARYSADGRSNSGWSSQ